MTKRWTVDEWGNGAVVLQDNDFKHDVALEIIGDFGSPEDELEYAEELCRRFNVMEPRIKMNKCNHPHAYKGDCCCNCKWHYPLFSHPSVDGKPMSHQDGWVCVPPEFQTQGNRAVKMSEHGSCEMWEGIK